LPKLPPPQPLSARSCAGQRPDSAKPERTARAGLYLPSNMIRWEEHPPSENLASNACCCAAKRRAPLSSETPSCGRCWGAAGARACCAEHRRVGCFRPFPAVCAVVAFMCVCACVCVFVCMYMRVRKYE
jgi:hypothetical protein